MPRFIKQFFPLVAFLLLQLSTACSVATAQETWRSVAQSAPAGLQQQLKQEYRRVNSPANPEKMQILKVQKAKQKVPLYLLDTRIHLKPGNIQSNPSCGMAGCLFKGYVQQGKGYREVLSVFLDPYPPEKKPLIEPSNTLQNGLPCLNFNQRQLKTGQVEVVQWCYDGQRYQFTSSSLRQP